MPMNPDDRLDTDAALRMLDLGLQRDGALDMALSIDNRGAPVEGESSRSYGDRKRRLDILGYDVHGAMRMAPGAASPSMVLSHLHVVRRSDAATASIANLLRSQAADLTLTLSIYNAGGDDIPDANPVIELICTGARVAEIAWLTGGPSGYPCEVIRFGYRAMKIQSASQTGSGQAGPGRICDLVAS